MKIHALQTGRVQVKRAQLIGQGHGLKRRLGPLTDTVWSDWLPTYAFAVEHADGVILIDTGSNAGLMNLPRWHPYSAWQYDSTLTVSRRWAFSFVGLESLHAT